jgi:hypothetical protein
VDWALLHTICANRGSILIPSQGLVTTTAVATMPGIYGAVVQGAVDWNTFTNEELVKPPGSCSP